VPAGQWHAEVKYDGYRALCALSNGRVAMWTRNGLDLAGRFPRIAQALARIVVGDAVIDGEVCVLDPQGVPRFELIQQGRTEEAVLFAFDLLRLDGEDLRGRALEERRDLLRSVLSNAPSQISLAEEGRVRVRGEGRDRLLFEAARGAAEAVGAGRTAGSACARRSAAARCLLGRAAPGRPGALYGVDFGRQAAPPGVPGDPRGQEAG